MNWKQITNIIVVMILIGMTILCECLYYQLKHNDVPIVTRTTSDTIITHITDTIFIPEYKIKYIDRIILDTIYLTDTILIREQLHYNDSIADIYISGIDPAIDSIQYRIPHDTIMINTIVEQTIEKRRRLSYGFSIGPSISYGTTLVNGSVYMAPSIGLSCTFGLQYNIKHLGH